MSKVGDIRLIADFEPNYDLVQTDYDVAAVLESIGSKLPPPPYLFVLVGDAEYLEVWTCKFPYLTGQATRIG